MSYQLEREMEYRLNRYHAEAAISQALPRGRNLSRLAKSLRRLADRLEARAIRNGFTGDASAVVLQGRDN